MNAIHAKLKIYAYSLFALTGIAVILRTCALLLAYETDAGYFALSTPLPTMGNALLILSLLWAFSMLIFMPRGLLTDTLPDFSGGSVFASALCGFCFIFYAALLFIRAYCGTITFSPDSFLRDRILHYLICAAALLAGMYFLAALKPALRTNHLRILLGFFVPIWALLALARCYFDLAHAMNNPIKIMLQMALIGMMLFFLQELRVLMGLAQPRFGLVCTFSALLLGGVGGLACLISLPKLSPVLSDYSFELMLLAALWLYVLFRAVDTVIRNLTPAVPLTGENN